ncbi:MAG: hypothetical protein LC749_19695 [Actinobacteria bacterium]|nr:hypothetical protein [Actinomycetota bacterium]
MTTRSLAIAASAVVAAAVIGLAYLLGAQGNHPSTTNTPAAAPPPGSARPTDLDAGRDPVATATAWLRAYRAISWTDPAPGSWVDRVRPYIGTELAADYQRDRQGSVGAGWGTFVAGKCTAIVRDVGGVIPPEAPRAPDSVYAQISGTVVTQCATGTPPPDEPVAATVEVRRDADGRWVVQQRLF